MFLLRTYMMRQNGSPKLFSANKFCKYTKQIMLGTSLLALLLLSACARSPASVISEITSEDPAISEETQTSLYKGLPIPTDTVVNVERTIILGSGTNWNGIVVMRSGQSVEDVAYFYQQQLAGSGWEEIAIVQGSNSMLTFTREGRVVMVRLKRKGKGTEIEATFIPIRSDTSESVLSN